MSFDDVTAEIDLATGTVRKTHVLLVVREDGSSQTFGLPDRGAIVIGRGDGCDVHVEDPTLSRRHARLHIGPPLRIEDLGSANGTRMREVDGPRVELRELPPGVPTPLSPGAVVELGTVTALVQHGAPAGRPRRLFSHGTFEAFVEKECARSSRTNAPFAVLRVRVEGRLSASEAQEVLAVCTRSADAIASYGPSEYEVLLVDARAAAVSEIRARIEAQLTERGGNPRIGVARWPEDGRDPESLVATAGARARDDEPFDRLPRVAVLEDPAMKRLYRMAQRVADSRIAVLLLGETGVGKDVLAEALHALSPRAKGPFLRINCAALTEQLLESELFGHERGAFTGATHTKPGLLEAASGGTVFLDEIGEIPLTTQAKLLRALEEGQVRRVGGLAPRPIDVRFVSATNRDLEAEAARGAFRGDLYFRLGGVTLTIPPLRARPTEIVPLARAFLAELSAKTGRPEPTLSDEAIQFLQRYVWPGNIRELRNVVERALLLSVSDVLEGDAFPLEKLGGTLPLASRSTAPPPLPSFRSAAPVAVAPPPDPIDTQRISRPEIDGALGLTELRARMDEAERRRVLDALEQCAGNQTKAAKLLGVSRGTLIARLEAFGVPRPRKV